MNNYGIQDRQDRESIFDNTIMDSLVNQPLAKETKMPKSFFFTQLNGIIKNINKSKFDLQSQDLEDLLTKNKFLPDALIYQLDDLKKTSNLTNQTVVKMLKEIFLGKFVLIGLIKCLSVIFLFTLPVILNKLTDEVRILEDQKYQNKHQILYYSLMLITFTVLQAITETQYSYQINKLELKTKVFLLETLYQSAMSRKSVSSEHTKHKSELMTLFAIDVNTILNFFISFHESWSLILKLIIGVVLLYIQMKSAVLVGVGTAVFLMIVNFSVAMQIGNYYQKQMIHKDERMRLLREFVSNPKQIKYLKWEYIWFDKIVDIRNKEFLEISSTKWLDSLCVLFWSITNTIISSATLIYYVSFNGQETLLSQNLFTIIYLFSLLTNPLNSLPWTISGMLQAHTSFTRIDTYLSQVQTFNYFQHQLKEDVYEQYQVIIPKSTYVWPSIQNLQEDQIVIKVQQDKIYPAEADANETISDQQKTHTFSLVIPELNLQRGKIYFVIGPTGSGKSSFIQAMLGQMEQIDGTKIQMRTCSYVPQTHWIVQTSVRNNITMNTQIHDFDRYLRCLHDCQLLEDIMQYPDLDLFDVGPEGSKLSGGQQQRLSLCRAIYNQHDLYLLDDVFSSLDPQVADQVFDKAIMSIVADNRICVLALNDTQLSRYIDRADEIFLIQNGQLIMDQGQIDKYVGKISIEQFKPNQSQFSKTNVIELKKIFTLQEPAPKQILKDHIKNTKLSLQFYFKQMGVRNSFVILISLILMQTSFNFYDTWLNSYLSSTPIFIINGSFILSLLVLTGVDIVVKIMRATSFAYGNLVQAAKIFQQLLKKIIFGQAGFFDKEDSGQILSRFSGDQNVVDASFPFELNILCNNMVNFVGTFVVLIYMKWILVFPTLISIFLFHQLQQEYRPTSLPLRRLDSQTAALLLSQMSDQQKGVNVIVAQNMSRLYQGLFTQALKNNIRVTWTSKSMSLWLQIRLQAVAGFMVLCVLSTTIIAAYVKLSFNIKYPNSGFNLSPSTLQLLLYYSLTKISLFRDLTLSLTTCEQELISYERILKYMNYKEETLNTPQEAHNSCQTAFVMENVWLDYSHQPELYLKPIESSLQKQDNHALKGVDINIQPGEMVAFCGRTGSGKTSILSMIFQLYKLNKGKIYKMSDEYESIDQQIIQKSFSSDDQNFNLTSWRQDISVIPQNGFVFKGTVKENLIPQDNQKKSNLLQKYMEKLPTELYLDQMLETGGKNISQGKRQVISFLRVLLEESNIICLDEATANVDNDIEDWTLQNLEILCRLQKKTIITISHRLESLKNYDRIFYVEDGMIRESGTFEELTIDKNSGFSRLRNQQQQI